MGGLSGSAPEQPRHQWNSIEIEARRSREEQNPNTWEQFKDAVRYAWKKARGKA